MCKYCNGDSVIREAQKDYLYLQVYENTLNLLGKVNQTPVKKEYKIKYCPMCGIKLVNKDGV